jgi:hypothetical protein
VVPEFLRIIVPSSRIKLQLIGMNSMEMAYSPLEFEREGIAVPRCGLCNSLL